MGAFNGSGTFVRSYSWQTDAANGIKIRADRMDTEDDGFAGGLSDCVTRDGQSPWTANLPAGGHKITGLAAGSAATDSATLAQVQSQIASFLAISGTDTYTGAGSPALAAYTDGLTLGVRFANANATTTPTLNIDAVGAAGLAGPSGGALVAADISAGLDTIVRYVGATSKFNILAAIGSFKTITSQIVTATGTYTPTPGTRAAIFLMCGGGAGGRQESGGNFAGGGGGAGEGFLGIFTAAAIGATQAITIGAGGAVSTNGGTTTLGTLGTALGGVTGGSTNGQGGLGGTGGTGTGFHWAGGSGTNSCLALSSPQLFGGSGGGSFFGTGGRGGTGSGDAGQPGVPYGSGGGGNGNSSATFGTAGAGKAGVLFVIEFG